MQIGAIGNTRAESAIQRSAITKESFDFGKLVDEIKASDLDSKTSKLGGDADKAIGEAVKPSTLSSSQIKRRGELNGDVGFDFHGAFTSPMDKTARPVGAAVNQQGAHGTKKTIDKTSELYEKCLALEGYFVKEMLSSMRATVQKGVLGGEGSNKIYEDMLYDEYATSMTKNANFGLADQMYLSLS